MKKILLSICTLSLYSLKLISCPTCVGRVKAESMPFFSNDFYQKNQSVPSETQEQMVQNLFKKLLESKKGKQ